MAADSSTVRWARTIALVFTWIVMGINGSMLYACLPDVLTRTNSTVEEISLAFSLGGIGGLFTPIFVIFVDKFMFYEEFVLSGFIGIGAITISMKGISTQTWQIGIYQLIESFVWGCINAVGQSVILRLWGEKSGPAMQALHLGYPIGSLIGPMIAVPFVSDTPADDTDENNTVLFHLTGQCLPYPNVIDMCMTPNIQPIPKHIFGISRQYYTGDAIDIGTSEYADDSSIEIALGIAGVLTGIVALSHLILQFIAMKIRDKNNGVSKEVKTVETESFRKMISPEYWSEGRHTFGVLVMVLTVLFFVCHVGSTLSILQYLPTYAVESDLEFTNREAAWLQAAVSISATVGRAGGILVAKYVSVNVMMVFELHGQVLFGILMLIFGSQNDTALWITACIYAIFREPTWPSGMTWPNDYIIMTGFLFSVLMICISLTSIPINYIIGFLFTNTTPDSIFYTTIGFGALNCIVYYLMLWLTYKVPPRFAQIETETTADVGTSGTFENDLFSKKQDTKSKNEPVLLNVSYL